MYKKTISLLIFISTLIYCTENAKLLGIFHYPGKSQYMSGVALMKILAERGHDVTVVSPIGEKNAPENYRDVVLPEVFEAAKRFMKNYFEYKVHPYVQTYVIGTVSFSLLNCTLSHPKLQQLIKTEKFDLVILQQFYGDALTYIPYVLDIPYLFYSPMGASYITNPSIGNPTFPSYVPDLFLRYTTDMSFFQRLDNTIIFIINSFIRYFVILPYHDRIVKESFPNAPDIQVYNQRASIILLNGDVSINDPVPKVPGMIDIGGFHIKPPGSLPRDLEDIMNTARSGVIYFSMGSNLRSVDMPKHILASLMNVFSKLNQTILWKWENDELEGKPDNVVIRKWLPQNDILAHKKMKLFITHAGLHSIQETVYHGVPCLTIPVFIDQLSNAKRAVNAGYAELIYMEEITEERLSPLIEVLLNNNNYTAAAKKRSSIMRDRPLSPADTASFWVNYAIRHKGAEHLRVASVNLTWCQYLLLDIVAFIFLCFLGIFMVLRKLTISLIKFRNCKIKKKLE
ncbi:hypothetical protein WA026_014405 [Henosepilachna vigintioctopunctata]|uniref:UDP-glucuronosyltransferase n=1 Tax=Henosepilachna vigintioctopunctata TaxID=420089 RepID=A0AAW1UM03_9CUCU